MWRSFFVWVATNPEEAAGLAAALVALLNALAFAFEKRLPKLAAVLRSLVPFVLGAIRSIRRPDASTGPAHKVVQPVIVADATHIVDADAPAPTRENPKVPPVILILALAVGCTPTARRDALEASVRLAVDRCTAAYEAAYEAATTPTDLARLDAVCVPAADALDALEASK